MCILIFGDSFARKFTLTKSPYIKVFGYSGGTMKGLSRENDNAKDIRKQVEKYKEKLKCVIFSFGQVDLHHSYYYVKLHKKEKVFDMKTIINDYVKFVKSLDVYPDVNIIVLSTYPSVLQDKYVYASLIVYKVITEEDFTGVKKAVLKKHANLKARVLRWKKWNGLLKKACGEDVKYIDIGPQITNVDGSVNEKYVDPGEVNIHLRWEPTLPILIKEINKINKCHMDTRFLLGLYKTDKQYITAKKQMLKEKVKNRSDVKLIELEKFVI